MDTHSSAGSAMHLLGYGDRIRAGYLARKAQVWEEKRQASYTLKDFAAEVGDVERGKGYAAQAVSEWIAERNEPSIATFRAIAQITGKPAEWLMALDRQIDLRKDRELATAEIDRAETTAAQSAASSAGSKKKAGGGKKRRRS